MSVKYGYQLIRLVALMAGLYCLLWPAPMFLLPKEMGEAYADWLFDMSESNDPSRFAALPFVYMLSFPVGVIITLGVIVEIIGSYLRKPDRAKESS
jgi:hypothetical protein